MAWIYLIIAGILEAGWAISMKYSCGFTKLWPTISTIACLLSSFAMFSIALKSLPLGTAYAVWTGIGAMGTAIVGMLFFDEARDVARIICISLILTGIVGLKLTSSNAELKNSKKLHSVAGHVSDLGHVKSGIESE